MDTRAYVQRRIAENVPEMAWRAGPVEEMRRWQERLRTRVWELLGGIEAPRSLLRVDLSDKREFETYWRETVRFETRSGVELFGYFLTPKGGEGRRPAVLCLPGHGRGVDSIVGIGPEGEQRAWGDWQEYAADFALQCVAEGYVVFAIEQISFGHRRDEKAQQADAGASSCGRDSTAALMLGETITGWRTWDAIRALDYMAIRPEVDPARMAVMGISGGGLTALFTACCDRRVKACVVSGYFNTFSDSILSIDHCVDNYVPGLLTVAEMPDLAGLIAPRLLFAESGERDNIFPLAAFERAVAKAREIYAAFGASDHFDAEVFPGEHQFHGVGAFRFLQEKL